MKKLVSCLVALILWAAVNASAGEPVHWLRNFDQAKQEAQKASKHIFVDVYADWCLWCKVLDKEVYVDPKFVDFMKDYVAAKIDAEEKGDGARFAARYEVETLPTLLVTDSDGDLVLRISGFRKADQLIQEIDIVRKLRDREAGFPDDPQTILELADEYLKQGMYDEAEKRIKKVRSSGRGRPAEDALLLMARLNVKLDSKGKALRNLKEFLEKYPQNPNAPQAREMLADLEK